MNPGESTNPPFRTSPVQPPLDLKRHVLSFVPLKELWPYLNFQMLLGHHLGVKGPIEQKLMNRDAKTMEILEQVKEVFAAADRQKLLQAKAVYQFFPVFAEREDLVISNPDGSGREMERFTFPRQSQTPHLNLVDYIRPGQDHNVWREHIGVFVVTAGIGAREAAISLKNQGEYLNSHILQALALELAEALAEKIHEVMRAMWGFPDAAALTMKDRLAGRYQGIRISPGYPACPNLEDQVKLFHLLNPAEIGVSLTEGYMMDPEASVSAFVFAHPEAKYFRV